MIARETGEEGARSWPNASAPPWPPPRSLTRDTTISITVSIGLAVAEVGHPADLRGMTGWPPPPSTRPSSRAAIAARSPGFVASCEEAYWGLPPCPPRERQREQFAQAEGQLPGRLPGVAGQPPQFPDQPRLPDERSPPAAGRHASPAQDASKAQGRGACRRHRKWCAGSQREHLPFDKAGGRRRFHVHGQRLVLQTQPSFSSGPATTSRGGRRPRCRGGRHSPGPRSVGHVAGKAFPLPSTISVARTRSPTRRPGWTGTRETRGQNQRRPIGHSPEVGRPQGPAQGPLKRRRTEPGFQHQDRRQEGPQKPARHGLPGSAGAAETPAGRTSPRGAAKTGYRDRRR